jgi:hypothetical protein
MTRPKGDNVERPEIGPNSNIETILDLPAFALPNGNGAFAVHKDRLSSEAELTVVDPYLSPEACRAKALDCLIKADALDNPREKALRIHYAEWWTRLAVLTLKRKDQNT